VQIASRGCGVNWITISGDDHVASTVINRILLCAETPGPRVLSDGCPKPVFLAKGCRIDTYIIHGGSPLQGDALNLHATTAGDCSTNPSQHPERPHGSSESKGMFTDGGDPICASLNNNTPSRDFEPQCSSYSVSGFRRHSAVRDRTHRSVIAPVRTAAAVKFRDADRVRSLKLRTRRSCPLHAGRSFSPMPTPSSKTHPSAYPRTARTRRKWPLMSMQMRRLWPI
jgi:hypothetical protein